VFRIIDSCQYGEAYTLVGGDLPGSVCQVANNIKINLGHHGTVVASGNACSWP